MEAKPAAMRIWYQSFTDAQQQRAYFGRLEAYLAAIAGPEVTFDVHGIDPPDHALHRLTEFRCAAQVVRNALMAEEQGYDAFVVGHFQDSGLYEVRSSVSMPVLGLGETSMLHACHLGRKIAVVTIDPIFIPMHEERIARYGLSQRVVAVQAIKTSVDDYMAAFDDPVAYAAVRRQFAAQLVPLVEAGIEVIIPAGGMPTLLFREERDIAVEGAVILNGLAVTAKTAELAVQLARLNDTRPSRASTFALPPAAALHEFLST